MKPSIPRQVHASEECLPPSSAPSAEVLAAALDIWTLMGSQHAIPVTGQSMWPTIRDGDRVWIAHDSKRLHRGDVIVYRRGDGLVIHRVVALHAHSDSSEVITQGDNRRHRDAPVERNQIIGRVIGIIRRGRTRQMPSGSRLWLDWAVAWTLCRLNTLRSRLH